MNSFTIFLGNMLIKFRGSKLFNRIGSIEDDVNSQYSILEGDTNMTDSKRFWKSLVGELARIADWLIPVIMIVMGMAGSIYAIVLGVTYAKAEGDDKKAEAKKKLINAVIGIFIGILIMLVFLLLLKNAAAIKIWIMGEAES